MKVAVLLYRQRRRRIEAFLAWVDPFAGQTLHLLPVPVSPNLGVFPEHDLALVSYGDYSRGQTTREWLDIYRLSDWGLRARLDMDCRAHFNTSPGWCTFLPSPCGTLVYVYKARSLGNHRAEDFVQGLDPVRLEFTPWTYKAPDCLAAWSRASEPAQAQMLFIADGLEVGRLPTTDLDQKVGFWLGPTEEKLRLVSIGPRPRAHNALGHARALLFAPDRPLSVVLCNDGAAHLIDPVRCCYLERQQVPFPAEHAMPNFAAQLDCQGRVLYVGTADHESRSQGLLQRLVVYDLQYRCRLAEWLLPEPFVHFALTADGRYLCGAGSASGKLWVLDARTSRAEAAVPLGGSPRYLVATC
jgi:hypothetical protein